MNHRIYGITLVLGQGSYQQYRTCGKIHKLSEELSTDTFRGYIGNYSGQVAKRCKGILVTLMGRRSMLDIIINNTLVRVGGNPLTIKQWSHRLYMSI